ARTPAVYETIFNFIVAFAEKYHREKTVVRFRFLTTALASTQRVDDHLSLDVLAKWQEMDAAALSSSMKALSVKYGARWAGTSATQAAARKLRRLHDSTAYLDTHSAWEAFRDSVDWVLGADGIEDLEESLVDALRHDARRSPQADPRLL